MEELFAEIPGFFANAWNLIVTFANPLNLLHPETYKDALTKEGVFEVVLFAVTLIVFTETGLLVGFLLPGDSMLVILGIVIQINGWSLWPFFLALCTAAILGDTVGYWIGYKTGPKIFRRADGRIFRARHLQTAREFYAKHGGKTIILARFIPIVRTFVPVVAGATRMSYATFLLYNVVGGIAWIFSMILLGFFLDPVLKDIIGPQFEIARHIDKVIVLVVGLSVLPLVWKWWTSRRAPVVPVAGAVPAASSDVKTS